MLIGSHESEALGIAYFPCRIRIVANAWLGRRAASLVCRRALKLCGYGTAKMQYSKVVRREPLLRNPVESIADAAVDGVRAGVGSLIAFAISRGEAACA